MTYILVHDLFECIVLSITVAFPLSGSIHALAGEAAGVVSRFEVHNMPVSSNGVGVPVQDTRICVVMVGLPARGKSFIAQKGT